jgi:glycosidase
MQVMEQLQSVMDFWLTEGVDGFNIDSVNLLMENFAASTGDVDKSMVSSCIYTGSFVFRSVKHFNIKLR